MKILYHHRTRCTDAQRVHILEMSQAFAEIGHEVEIVSVVDSRKLPVEESADPWWKKLIRHMPLGYEALQLAYNLVAIPWLIAKVVRLRADFIYERYSLLNFSGVVAARLCRKPIVLEVNSPLALEQDREKEIRAARLAAWMERVTCNAATKVIVVSGPLRRIMINSGVLESKLLLMPNGVNLEHLHSGSADDLQDRLGLHGKTVIGFVGWFRKWHGLDLLIEAFAGLPQGETVLLFVGDGPAMADLRQQAKAEPVRDSIVFTGAVPHEEIPAYLKLIDIAVQPAANEYCCPMKIIEYMGLGKAIVAPRQENIEELLEDGREALFFTPGDREELRQRLDELVRDRDRREALGAAGLEAIHRRGMLWNRNAAGVIQVVESTRARPPAHQALRRLSNHPPKP